MGKRILITGTGTSGSWKIRAEQLGGAIGAAVVPLASLAHCRRADLVVVMKRVRPETLAAIRAAGLPVVWDVVDAWPQRPGTSMPEREARRWLRDALRALSPAAVVWPTGRMGADAGWKGPQLVLPHHAWPRYMPRPVADQVRVVGYEGAAHYLGKWRAVLEQECALRGWRLEVNGNLAQADIGLALRDGGGYPAAHWKSNCKLANLQALGIPALCSPEAGYRETDGGSVIWIEVPGDIARAFDRLADRTERERLGALAVAAAPRIDRVAGTYRGWLDGL